MLASQLALRFAQWESRTLDPYDGSTTTIYRYQGYLQEMNTGAMKSFQADPTDTTTGCATITGETNTLIEYMFNEDNYTDATFSQDEFIENGQIMAFAMMDQFEQCGVIEFLTVFDAAASKLPQTMSAFASFGTQIGLGWETHDTSAWLAFAEIQEAYENNDQEEWAQGMGLLISQILKFQADGASVDVAPTGN